MKLGNLVIAAVLMCATAAAVAQNDAPTYTEWSTETRTSLGFRVNAEAVRALLPPGWSVASVQDTNQVNISLTFMDRHLVLDPQGQVVRSGASRYMVMAVQARNSNGQNSTLIINGISPESSGSYEVYQQASRTHAARVRSGDDEDSGRIEEHWEMAAESGDSIRLSLTYRPAPATRRQASQVIRSGKNTDFTRTYKTDQASDVLGLPGAPDSRIEAFSFEASGPVFSKLFDGTEVLTGVTSIPFYTREIYIP